MRATEFIVETAMMGKIADSGKIIRILKKAHTVPFSDEKNWLLVDTDPGKGNSGLGIKWISADTRFEWVRPYKDSVDENLSPQTIHKLADHKGVKWDDEPSFLQLTKRLTGKEHLDDLDQGGLNKVKKHLDGLQGLAEGATVTRIDSKLVTDFSSGLKAYKHTDDWSQSGLDTGDDSYWKNKNLKTNTTKGLFAGDPRRTALYATGNAYETRYVEFTQNGQPIVYFDQKDLPAMRSRKTYLTVFDAGDFRQLPTGEWFSENPSKPIKQMPIGDPFKYIASQGWIVRVTDDLGKVFKQVKNMHKAGKIAHYGAEGMNESKQGVAEEINSDVFNPAFNDTQIFDELTYRATAEKGYNDKTYFQVKVLDSNFQQVGLAKFSPTKRGLVSAMTWVHPEYQGQGLARNIYAYVRSLGNTIAPSRNQLPAGKAMWASWKKSGDAKYLMNDVAENFADGRNTEKFLGEYPSIETKLGEETHPDLVKYNKNFQKQLHRDLDVGKGKKTDIDYDSDEKDWSDLTHVQDYTGGSLHTNDYLHRQYRNKAKAKELTIHQAKIQAMDRILANNKLPQQIVVYTGLSQSPAEAWETYKADVTKPIRLHLPAYTSTTTKLKVALEHAGEGEITQVSRARHPPRNKDAPGDEWGTQILMMTLPAGLPAASVKKISEWPDENEILLPRGIDIEINPNPTVLRDGDYVWHAKVLSHSPVQIASPMQENFADGRNPQDKGDAKRHGINTRASVSSLRKTAKSGGRKGQLAHWLANMKSGRAKKK